LGAFLLNVGLALAVFVGRPSGLIAAGLTALILLYDGGVKRTFLGPLAMGGCRALNVMLGASAIFFAWGRPQILVAAALGIYIAGVTWFARHEARRSARPGLVGAAIVIHAGFVAFAAIPFQWPGDGDRWIALAGVALIAAFVDVAIVGAFKDGSPRNVQMAVRRQLLAIVLLEATMIYFKTGSVSLAGATALLVIPAATLGRWIMIT
jgi:4-hydroxybenzoate polyprenyltransferase